MPPPDAGTTASLLHLATAFVILAVPTACMGATLPILAKGLVQRTAQIGSRIGWLYALPIVLALVACSYVGVEKFVRVSSSADKVQ